MQTHILKMDDGDADDAHDDQFNNGFTENDMGPCPFPVPDQRQSDPGPGPGSAGSTCF